MEAQVKAHDLRIGNWVEKLTHLGDTLGPCTVEPRDFLAISLHPEWIRPIPLTKEILLKCGFGTDAGGYVEYENQVELILNTGNFILPKELCTYVHQLQNLYQDFTGQELNIEL